MRVRLAKNFRCHHTAMRHYASASERLFLLWNQRSVDIFFFLFFIFSLLGFVRLLCFTEKAIRANKLRGIFFFTFATAIRLYFYRWNLRWFFFYSLFDSCVLLLFAAISGVCVFARCCCVVNVNYKFCGDLDTKYWQLLMHHTYNGYSKIGIECARVDGREKETPITISKWLQRNNIR